MKKSIILALIAVSISSINSFNLVAQNNEWKLFLQTNGIYKFLFFRDKMYMATNAGLIKHNIYTGENDFINKNNHNFISNCFLTMTIDSSGSVWVCSETKYLYRINDTSITYFPVGENGLPIDVSIQKMETDAIGNVWLLGSHILKFNGLSFEVYSSDNGTAPTNTIKEMAPDTLGNIFILDYNDNIWKRTPNNTYFPIISNGTIDGFGNGYNVSCMKVDKNNNLWFVCSQFYDNLYLFKFDGSQFYRYVIPPNINLGSYPLINEITMDDLGNNIYILVNNWILIKFDGTNWSFKTLTSGIASVYTIYEHSGSLWVSGNNQVCSKIINDSIIPIDVSCSGLQTGNINKMIKVNDKYWFCGSNGITSLDMNGVWKTYNSSNTIMQYNFVSDIAADSNNVIWIASDKLYKLKDSVLSIGFPEYYETKKIIIVGDTLWMLSRVNTATSVIKFFDNQWVIYNNLNSPLPGDEELYYYDIQIDKRNELWVIKYSGGLWSYNGTFWKTHPIPILSYAEPTFSVDSFNNKWFLLNTLNEMWLLGYNGDSIFFSKKLISYSNPNNNYIGLSSAFDKYNNIWISIGDNNSYQKSVGKYFFISKDFLYNNGGAFYSYDIENTGLTSNFINSIVINDNEVYFATRNGCAIYNPWFLQGNGGYLTISGKVVYDINNNNLFDTSDIGISMQKISISQPNESCYTDTGGNFYFIVNNGYYQLNYNPSPPWMLASGSNTISINTAVDTLGGYVFFIKPSGNLRYDFTTDIVSVARCNDTVPLWLTLKNVSTLSGNFNLSLLLDSLFEFLNAYPQPYIIVGDTIKWQNILLQPFDEFRALLTIKTPDETHMGDTLKSFTKTDVVFSDSFIKSKNDTTNQILLCSYDPNDKQVFANKGISNNQIFLHDTLTYTIRFQNTGNDTAFNIVIRDTFDIAFNIESFKYVSASHFCTYRIVADKVLEIYFPNIKLPPSFRDDFGSNGFFKYSITPLNNVINNTLIKNTAYIFFDYNPAIITNTVINILRDTLNGFIESPIDLENLISVFPNPFNDFTTIYFKNNTKDNYVFVVYDTKGNIVYQYQTRNNYIKFVNNNYKSGLYFFKLMGTKNYFGKFIIQN